jgi:hypothetical protein
MCLPSAAQNSEKVVTNHPVEAQASEVTFQEEEVDISVLKV